MFRKKGYVIAAIVVTLLGISIAFVLLQRNNSATSEKADDADKISESLDATESYAENEAAEEETAYTDPFASIFPETAQYEGVSSDVVCDYVPPSEYDLHIPEELKGFCGLKEIQDTVKTVADAEADSIEKELSTGTLGDGLDFDPMFYPYYAILNDDSKQLYRQIYANACELTASFRAVDKDVSDKQLYNIFTAVLYDHPEVFWMNAEYTALYKENGELLEVDLSYNETADDIENSRAEFDEAVARIASEASGTDYDKERYVHDALAEHIKYQDNPLDQSAYSGLVTGETVCAGYTGAFSCIMTKLGIPCYICEGHGGEAHEWNIVCINGEYYNVDLTWDDTDPEGISYNYFNKTDADYGFTHIRRNLSIYLPACTGETYRDHDPDEFNDYVMTQDIE